MCQLVSLYFNILGFGTKILSLVLQQKSLPDWQTGVILGDYWSTFMRESENNLCKFYKAFQGSNPKGIHLCVCFPIRWRRNAYSQSHIGLETGSKCWSSPVTSLEEFLFFSRFFFNEFLGNCPLVCQQLFFLLSQFAFSDMIICFKGSQVKINF